jgi:secondary thiamine-phosphate synthase enzyme
VSLYEFSLNSSEKTQMIEITERVQEILEVSRVVDGSLKIFIPHTTAGVTINENADPDVCGDMVRYFNELVGHKPYFRHAEGNSDAHIKASMIGSSVEVFVSKGRMILGTWQGIYFFEFDGPRNRRVYVKTLQG